MPSFLGTPFGRCLAIFIFLSIVYCPTSFAEIHTLSQGEFSFSDPTGSPQKPWNPINLPDNWNLSHPNQGGIGWYHFDLVLSQSPTDSWGIYLPRLSVNAEVFINGQRVGSGGRFTEPVTHNSYRPLLFPFVASLLHTGHNTITVRMLGYANESSGLIPIQLGPLSSLEEPYQHQWMLKVLAPTLAFFLLVMLSLIFFTLWVRRRHETVYLMFFLCGAFSSLYTSTFFVQHPPLSHHTWLWLVYSAVMGYVFCALLLIHRFVGLHRPLLERWIAAYTVLGPILIAVTTSTRMLFYFGVLDLGYAALSLYILYIIMVHHHKTRRSESFLLFGTLLFSALTGYHDIGNMLFPQPQINAYYFYWGATMLAIAMALMLLLRFDRSLLILESINQDLHHRVDQKKLELQHSVQERQALQTRHAIFAERERIMRDLHDGLGGYLVSALVQTERIPIQPNLLQQTLRTALNDLRMMIDSLDSAPEDILIQMGSLRERLEACMESSQTNLHWDVHDAPQLPNPNPSTTVSLMRMIQEIFTNIAKHSGAHHAYFSAGPDYLEITDDGHGFNVQSPPIGRGLPNLQQRAKQIGLVLSLQSSSTGTRVRLTWPKTNAR